MLPILYQSHDLILYSYPLFMGIGWGVAYEIFFSRKPSSLSFLKAQYLFWGLFVCSWIGAKILYSLTHPDHMELSHSLSFWMGGGFVFYGGLIGGLTFILLNKLLDKSFCFDFFSPLLPGLLFGHAVGRIGCFLAGCCFGAPTNFGWGVYMHNHYRHPTQLLEAIGLIIFGFYVLNSKLSLRPLLGRYLIFYGLLRYGVEILRGDTIRGFWVIMTPSQWISLSLIILGAWLQIKEKQKS